MTCLQSLYCACCVVNKLTVLSYFTALSPSLPRVLRFQLPGTFLICVSLVTKMAVVPGNREKELVFVLFVIHVFFSFFFFFFFFSSFFLSFSTD